MNVQPQSCDLTIDSDDNQRLADLCGQFDEHLRRVEETFGVEINSRGNVFQIIGEPASARQAGNVLKGLYEETAKGPLSPAKVHLFLQGSAAGEALPR